MPTKPDIVKEIRDNLAYAKKADRHNRTAYRDNMKFLNGEQWDGDEVNKRRNKRLMLTADQLNSPVDQVVNNVRQNKPGPDVRPSGEGTDKEDAEIMAGILRRIDYENRAWIPFGIAMECATGGNFGCFGVDVEWKNERSFERKIVVSAIPDPNETVYFDPESIEKDRSDMAWAIEAKHYSNSAYQEKFGRTSLAKRGLGVFGSLFEFFGVRTESSMDGWLTKEGVLVVRYWKVINTPDVLTLYSNNMAYWKSETPPEGATVVNSRPGTHREIKWFISDGIDVLKDGDWEGYWIPLFPVYGRERWIEGKRYITSLIQLAKEAQQAFNFAFTGACEVLALSTKAPWIGLVGQFKTMLAKWGRANTEPMAFLEFDEVPLANNQTYTTPPQRQLGEPPIQAFMSFCNLCINAIQRATSIFDPSLGKQKSDQSGRAIQELQAQSSQGNFHWSDNLTIALTHYYRAMADLVQNEYDAPQVTQILRADGTAMAVRINEEFKAGVDPDGKDINKHYKVSKGDFAFTVAVGQSYDSQLLANESKVSALIKVLPPELVAQAADIFIKLQNYGQLGDQLADRLTPPQYRSPGDPNSAAQHLAQMMQQNQQLKAAVQQLQHIIDTKQPELEMRRQVAIIQALAGIEEKRLQIGASQADRLQDSLEHTMDLAHDAGSDAADRSHDITLAHLAQGHNLQSQQQAQDASAESQDQQHAHELEMQEQQPVGEGA